MSTRMPRRAGARDRWIPLAFLAFFATFITVNGVMVVLALDSFSGVTTQNAYLEGLAYNRTLEEAKREKALGWTAQVAFSERGPQAGRLAVTLLDRHGVPLSHATVDAQLVRPAQQGYDFAVSLASEGAVFAADLALPLPGQWEVRLVAAQGEAVFRHRQRIFVP